MRRWVALQMSAGSSGAVRPDLIHVRQRFNWDCGLACAEMLLRTAGLDVATLTDELAAPITHNSVWTADVALALARRGLLTTFYTVMPGVNPAHRGLTFYSHFDDDAARMPGVFADACRLGVAVQERRVSCDELCDKLSQGTALFICLVDLRHLSCSRCVVKGNLLQFTYAGHYILLRGYSYETDEVEFLDPARPPAAGSCYISLADLRTARTAAGTDEDLLEVPLPLALRAGGAASAAAPGNAGGASGASGGAGAAGSSQPAR